MKKTKLHITELFMAKADWDRCFHGVIIRENDLVRGKILLKNNQYNCYVYATAPEQVELGEKLDEIIKLILDYNILNGTQNFLKQNEFNHFLN